MAAKTRLAQYFYPARAYGIFTAKTSAVGIDIKNPKIEVTNFDKQIKWVG